MQSPKTSTLSLQSTSKDDVVIAFGCALHVLAASMRIFLASSASLVPTKHRNNQSESEKMRPDTINIQRTTGAKTTPLSLVSMKAEDVCPWPLWYLKRRVRPQTGGAMPRESDVV